MSNNVRFYPSHLKKGARLFKNLTIAFKLFVIMGYHFKH